MEISRMLSEMEVKDNEWNTKYKNRSEEVTLQTKQNYKTNKGYVQNNVSCHSKNINFCSPYISSKSPQRVDQSCSHLKNVEEERINETTYKTEPSTVIKEPNPIEISKTRDEIVQQRKIKVAARKNEKKLANKQKKEEEYFKKIMAPKYKGVTLIKAENLDVAKESVSIPELSDFPCLGSTFAKKKTVKKSVTEVSQDVVRKGKPKKFDPISLNILDVINCKKIEQKSIVPVTKLRSNNTVISGNILDSDNPQRKRGKVRLGKKVKPSRMKAHILKVRQEKLTMRNSASTSFNQTKKLNLTNEEKMNCQFLLNIESFKQHPDSMETVIEDGIMVDSGHKVPSLSQTELDNKIVHTLHSRRFREYCDNIVTPTLVESVCNLLTVIVKFQDRLYARDPIKAHAKRRYVTGLREAEKYLKLGKVKVLIIAPDLEKIPGERGLDAFVLRLKEEAQKKFVPYVFGPNRKKLGFCTFKKQKISAVAILNFEGAEAQFTQVVSLLNEARIKYKALIDERKTKHESEVKEDKTATNVDQNKEIQSKIISSFLEKLRLKD